ncbi:uncharacterized protein [Elaeis guineensis]|uniref:uncharacterized protein isoform X2 n=1 Tax=Elaeis guineensis var. tenera TaxID=51953 RepID=UPI003C6CDACD
MIHIVTLAFCMMSQKIWMRQLPKSTEQTSTPPEPVQPEVMTPQHHLLTGTQQRRAVRGLSRGLVLEKYMQTHNEKPKVQIFRDHPVGTEDNMDFEDCTDEQMTACILKMTANRYRDRRCRLHKYCNELQAKGIDPVTQPYRNWAGFSDD